MSAQKVAANDDGDRKSKCRGNGAISASLNVLVYGVRRHTHTHAQNVSEVSWNGMLERDQNAFFPSHSLDVFLKTHDATYRMVGHFGA